MTLLDAVAKVLAAWRKWGRLGSQGINREPRPVHEYPEAQTELFRLQTVAAQAPGGPARLANTVPPADVIDGRDLQGISFRARTLTLIATDGRDLSQFDFDTGLPVVPTATNPSGTITVEVRGLHGGGVYWRRFDLTPYKAIEINCETWRRVWVRPLFSQLSGFDLVAILTEEPNAAGRRDRVFYAQPIAHAGGAVRVWSVPPGAVAMTPNFTDAGSGWQSYDRTGIRRQVVTGFTAGVRQLVQGAQLFLSAATTGGHVIWEIEL